MRRSRHEGHAAGGRRIQVRRHALRPGLGLRPRLLRWRQRFRLLPPVPSASVRASSTDGREGLLSNELFCFDGPELVVNGLLGYDQTAEFCRRLGFQIHRPTGELSSSQTREHNLEFRAQRLVSHITGVPTPNLYCRHLNDDLLKFECQDFIGGRIVEVELVEKGNRYVVKGCEHLGVRRTKHGFSREACALPDRSS